MSGSQCSVFYFLADFELSVLPFFLSTEYLKVLLFYIKIYLSFYLKAFFSVDLFPFLKAIYINRVEV